MKRARPAKIPAGKLLLLIAMARKNITFNGLGFPVILIGANFKTSSYGDVLDVDMNALEGLVFRALIRKPARFSGAEVKFIRFAMDLTQNVFADLLNVERSAIGKWEAKDLAPTGMSSATEFFLRIQMIRFCKMSADGEIPVIEPAIRKKNTGKPIELAV